MTQLASHVRLTPTEDGAILLDDHTGHMAHLNTSAHESVLAVVSGGVEVAVRLLCTRYGITEDRARHDIGALLTDLGERGLIEGERL